MKPLQNPKIFGVGLSRTGTMSLSTALELLGVDCVHYPSDPITRREILTFLDRGGDTLSLTVLESRQALTDTPVCCVYQALDRAYPDSKFILTTRDEASWLESCVAYWGLARAPGWRRQTRRVKMRARAAAQRLAGREVIVDPRTYAARVNEAVYGHSRPDVAQLRATRERYETQVRDHFADRPESLLVLDICGGEGWEKLCSLLGTDVPEASFPFTNTLLSRPSADDEGQTRNAEVPTA